MRVIRTLKGGGMAGRVKIQSQAEKPPARYVALLRAVNVGGHAVLKMEQLKKHFESFGLKDVTTCIQSGNVLFTSRETGAGRLARGLEKKLRAALGYAVVLFVLTPEQLRKAAAQNPFDPERLQDKQHCHLMFLSAKPQPSRRRALMALAGREYRFAVKGRVFYYAYDRAFEGRNRRAINFEKVLGLSGTARTWKVVARLVELAGA